MKIAIRLFLALLLLGLGFTLGFWTFAPKPVPTVLGDAMPLAFGPFDPCVEATTDEMALFSLAVEVYGSGPRKLEFARHRRREISRARVIRNSKEETVPVCDPPEIYERAGHLISQYRTFDQGRLVEYELQLASRIKAPTPNIVKAIAKSAFHPSPQISYIYEHEDTRGEACIPVQMIKPGIDDTGVDRVTVTGSIDHRNVGLSKYSSDCICAPVRQP